jgi:hypothetical protein
MGSPEHLEIARDRQPPVVKGESGVVALSQDHVPPLVGRFLLEDDVEAVILVPARVVILELRQLTDDAGVREAGLLLELPKQARLEALVRGEPAGRDLDPQVRVLVILEHEQLCAAVSFPCDVGDDALPTDHARSARIFALYSRLSA